MTEKQQQALDTVFSTLPEECRESYREIADYVISLGCKPVLRGVHKDYVDFVSSKLKRALLKISADPILSQRITVFFRMLSACGSPNGNGWDTRKMLWLRRMQREDYPASCRMAQKASCTDMT